MAFTNSKQLDLVILQKLDDKDIRQINSVNKYINSLIKDDTFWLNRILLKFEGINYSLPELKRFFVFKTWKQLYEYLLGKLNRHTFKYNKQRGNIRTFVSALNKYIEKDYNKINMTDGRSILEKRLDFLDLNEQKIYF